MSLSVRISRRHAADLHRDTSAMAIQLHRETNMHPMSAREMEEPKKDDDRVVEDGGYRGRGRHVTVTEKGYKIDQIPLAVDPA